MKQHPATRGQRILLFDFDSTIVAVETLDELIRLSLAEHSDSAKASRLIRDVEEITNLGMNGDIDLLTSITRRLQLGHIHRRHVEQFRTNVVRQLTPGFRELMESIEHHGDTTYIISGGFRECIEPVVSILKLPAQRILANTLFYDVAGNVTGINTGNPLSSSSGKSTVIRGLRKRNPLSHFVMIGDGSTDLQTWKDKVVDDFIGFGGHCVRERVRKEAPHFCMNCAELTSLLFPTTP